MVRKPLMKKFEEAPVNAKTTKLKSYSHLMFLNTFLFPAATVNSGPTVLSELAHIHLSQF